MSTASAPAAAPADARTVQVTDVVDGCGFRGLPLWVFLITLLALVFDGFDIQAIGFIAPALIGEWGISRAQLGPVLAAGLIGMALGAIALGPLGDRIGRKTSLVAAMGLIAAGSLASAFVQDPLQLTICRFFTGLGLGGCLPNATALIMEFAPLTLRNLMVSVTIVGVPVGGVLGAEVAARLLPEFGWRAIVIVGAFLPAVLALVMWKVMPESPRFLARHPARHGELAHLLNRLVGENRFQATDRFFVAEHASTQQRSGVAALLSTDFRRDTLLLWVAFLSSIFCVYAFFNWLPTVLSGIGLPVTVALRGALVFNLGGVVGSLIVAAGMSRFGSKPILLALAGTAIVSMLWLAAIVGTITQEASLLLLLSLMSAAGLAILGTQVGLYSLAAHAYPTTSRASGVGAAVGIGRLGGILSSFLGSAVAAMGDGITTFFVGIAAVVALTGGAVACFGRQIPASRR